MNCQNIADWLDDHEPEFPSLDDRETLGEHMSQCMDCRDAWHASWAVGALANALAQAQPRPELFEQVLHRVAQAHTKRSARRFWLGTAAAAIAASFIVSALGLALLGSGDSPLGAATAPRPMLTFSLHEAHDISVAIESPQVLPNAAVRVSLSEGLALVGYEGRREVSWHTDIARGVNRLMLPVTATAIGAGRLLVEVEHENKRETFIVEIDVTAEPGSQAGTPEGSRV